MQKVLYRGEVSNMLGVTERTIRHWEQRGYFPRPGYIGGRAAYDAATVEAWIARQLEAI